MSVSGITGKTGVQISSILNLSKQLEELNRQLGTGQKSINYAGLGLDRGLSMALNNQLSTVNSFQESVKVINARLGIMQNALTESDKAARAVKGFASNSTYSLNPDGQTLDQQTSAANLDIILNSLNVRFGDQYVFSGKSTDIEPVETASHILDGDGVKSGLRQLMAERLLADMGTSNMGRLVIPPLTTATLIGTGATITPDAMAVANGAQNIGGAFASAGGTLVINGTTVNIAAGDDAADVLAAINAPGVVAATGVTAALGPGNVLQLTGVDADTSITIDPASSLLAELGMTATTSSPTNLLSQGVVTNPQTLTIAVGANAPLTITFGTNNAAIPPEVSTLAELNAQLGTLVGGTASVDPATGNITVSGAQGDMVTIGGTANAAAFGLPTGTVATTNNVSISEDAAGHPFGMKIAAVNTTFAGATVTAGAPPQQYSIQMANNPIAGQSANFVFNLPDGTTTTISLMATDVSPPGKNQFLIGATPDITAANLRTALNTEVSKTAATALGAASAMTVSRDFFNANAGNPPTRVVGPPFDSATTLTAGTSANTVIWYRGEAGSDPARNTAFARVDTSISVSYGARANEQAFKDALANVAAFTALSFSPTDPNGSGRYEELKIRVTTGLGKTDGVQNINDVTAELAVAYTKMTAGKDRQQQTKSALETMIESINGVPTEQVGAQILALQTRLQASLQTTAMLSKTSLVYFLS